MNIFIGKMSKLQYQEQNKLIENKFYRYIKKIDLKTDITTSEYSIRPYNEKFEKCEFDNCDYVRLLEKKLRSSKTHVDTKYLQNPNICLSWQIISRANLQIL